MSRPGPFGNPFSVREAAQELGLSMEAAQQWVVQEFERWVALPVGHETFGDLYCYGWTREQHATLHARLGELRGKNVACWCRADQPCHGDVLLRLANAPACVAVAP